MAAMCNATLSYCRSCFNNGGVFVAMKDEKYCCAPNLATLEGYLYHPFKNVDDCPDEEGLKWTMAYVAAGGIACATVSALAYGLYRKFFGSRRARETISTPTVIAGRERVSSPYSGYTHANESFSDDGTTLGGSRGQESVTPGSMQVVAVDVHARPESVATATSVCAARPPRARWTRLNDFDPDEDNDFNMLRAWGDGIPMRQFTRRTTSHRETETHECGCIKCPHHSKSHSESVISLPAGDTDEQRAGSRGKCESDDDAGSEGSQRSFSWLSKKETILEKNADDEEEIAKNTAGNSPGQSCSLLSGSETEWEPSGDEKEESFCQYQEESSGESDESLSLRPGNGATWNLSQVDENESSNSSQVSFNENSHAENLENNEKTQDAKDAGRRSGKRRGSSARGQESSNDLEPPAKQMKNKESQKDEQDATAAGEDDEDISWRKDFWKDTDYNLQMGLGDLLAMNMFPQDYPRSHDEMC